MAIFLSAFHAAIQSLLSFLQAVWPARAASSSQTHCADPEDALNGRVRPIYPRCLRAESRRLGRGQAWREQAWREHEKPETQSFSTGSSSCSRIEGMPSRHRTTCRLIELRSARSRVLLSSGNIMPPYQSLMSSPLSSASVSVKLDPAREPSPDQLSVLTIPGSCSTFCFHD